MIKNPMEECPPDEPVTKLVITATLSGEVWTVSCPQWKCELRGKNLTRLVACLIAEIECFNETGELPASNRYSANPPKRHWGQRPPDDGTRTPRVHLWQAPT